MRSEVLTLKPVGGYLHLTLIADSIADRARPGSFVTLGIGGETSAMLRPRAFWLHRVRHSGLYGGTVEVVFTPRSPATRWLAQLSPHDPVVVTGPLGRPFALPTEPVSCAVVGHGYGVAPLFMLAERLRERDCRVHMVLGASTERELFGGLEARRAAQSVTVATADGSVGIKGGVADALPAVLRRNQTEVVYACGPLGVLRAVAALAGSVGAWCQVAMEAQMACGLGVCLSCVVPVRGPDNITRPTRCCIDGPVFAGDRVDWSLLP
ncbi:MAG: dihydroorotate dehydrogenase electron transfer subunit [Nocardioidaceae bacterium]|nr:dihydroorotate dehydrogenase electron transfer subunit [Nocardioidaceae bacterium]